MRAALAVVVGFLGLMLSVGDMYHFALTGSWDGTLLESWARSEVLNATLSGREPSAFSVWVMWQGAWIAFVIIGLTWGRTPSRHCGR